MPQQKLADAIGVSRTQIADWEGARHAISGDALLKIADALGMTLLAPKHPTELQAMRRLIAEEQARLKAQEESGDRLP